MIKLKWWMPFYPIVFFVFPFTQSESFSVRLMWTVAILAFSGSLLATIQPWREDKEDNGDG